MDTEGIDGVHLHSFVQRIERLQEELDALNGDKGEVFKEAKSCGFDLKILKIVIKRRRMGKECDEEDTLVELYEQALEVGSTEPRAGARAREEEAAPSAEAIAGALAAYGT